MRRAKIIALIVASAFLVLMSYEVALPLPWTGCGFAPPKRKFTVPGTSGKLRIVEAWPTQLYYGGSRIDVPISPSFALAMFVALGATLAGFAPMHQPALRLLGFSILALVFTHFAVHLAAVTGEGIGFLLERQFEVDPIV